MGQKPSRQHAGSIVLGPRTILNDEVGTVLVRVDAKSDKVEPLKLRNGTLLGVDNVCKHYAEAVLQRLSEEEKKQSGDNVQSGNEDDGSSKEDTPHNTNPTTTTPITTNSTTNTPAHGGKLSSLKRRKSKVRAKRKNTAGGIMEDKTDEEVCMEMIEHIFMVLITTRKRRRELITLPFEAIKNLLQSDSLMITDEFTLFLLVGAWADNFIEERTLEARVRESVLETTLSHEQEQDAAHEMVSTSDEAKENADPTNRLASSTELAVIDVQQSRSGESALKRKESPREQQQQQKQEQQQH
eukprot:TRINITY_DN5930_c0_g1_i3.p1 TRINITY_DN5930_c0_g1~~TRINITY_DN5930_c0_g1_i3.p1  ORF type:complete len:298 (-),score=101.20 TRINITY_DN5930_c0_g1_i3:62-955(-)